VVGDYIAQTSTVKTFTDIEAKFGALATADIATGGQITKRQLDFNLASDQFSASNITSSTWTDCCSNQSFTVDDANSTVEISVRGAMNLGGQGTTETEVTSAILIDGSTRIMFGGCMLSGVASNKGNPLTGNACYVTGLSAGSHTVKVQIWSNQNLTGLAYLRASSQPNLEFLAIQVVEHKR
jgi:hypothetical protein